MPITYCLYDDQPHNEHEVLVGDTSGCKSMNDYGRRCHFLMADGVELDQIRRQFDNIPILKWPPVKMRWTGEMAAFIAMNLQL